MPKTGIAGNPPPTNLNRLSSSSLQLVMVEMASSRFLSVRFWGVEVSPMSSSVFLQTGKGVCEHTIHSRQTPHKNIKAKQMDPAQFLPAKNDVAD